MTRGGLSSLKGGLSGLEGGLSGLISSDPLWPP